jgi:hypothetical protein
VERKRPNHLGCPPWIDAKPADDFARVDCEQKQLGLGVAW